MRFRKGLPSFSLGLWSWRVGVLTLWGLFTKSLPKCVTREVKPHHRSLRVPSKSDASMCIFAYVLPPPLETVVDTLETVVETVVETDVKCIETVTSLFGNVNF